MKSSSLKNRENLRCVFEAVYEGNNIVNKQSVIKTTNYVLRKNWNEAWEDLISCESIETFYSQLVTYMFSRLSALFNFSCLKKDGVTPVVFLNWFERWATLL